MSKKTHLEVNLREVNPNLTSGPLRIRGHHLLCMQGFQGYGYNHDFAVHMQEVVDFIMKKPSCDLELIAECDELCSQCPNRDGKICSKDPRAEENIQRMDLLVLEKLGIPEGSKIQARKILEHVNNVFKTRKNAMEVCRNCLWLDQCLWFMGKPI